MRSIFRAVFVCALSAFSFAAANKLPVTPSASQQLMYLATWPHTIHVIDINQNKIIDNIDLPTDIARIMLLSPDKTKLFVSTMRDNCIVTVDLKSRRVMDSFSLNEGTTTNRLSGLAVDPTGKYLYSIVTVINKKSDRYEISDPKFALIDIAQKKIIKTGSFPKDESPGGRALLRVSPDGKSLYVFRQHILVVNTDTLQVTKTIELSNPIAPPGMDNLSLSVLEDPNEPQGKLMSIFNASDPYVHREIFGLAEIDLSRQTFDLTPIGPAATSIQPLMLSPDRKLGYTVAINGTHGDRVTEFWVFNMDSKKIINKREFIGRTRLNFGMTADGKKLLIYNAGYQVEVYDAKTLALESTINLEGDTTSNLVVLPLTN